LVFIAYHPSRGSPELSFSPKSFHFLPRRSVALVLVIMLLAGARAGAVPPPTTEFDIPYRLRIVSDGTVLELSGSFSWALPQSLQAVLASAPRVRVVRLESPGGQVLAALQVAAIIQRGGFDTYVGRFCASACTVAFLGGRHRWLASGARLGFHQAHAPGAPPERFNAILEAAYEKFGVPPIFVVHVLNTPPTDLWYPTQRELRAAHFTTGDAPAALLALGRSPLPSFSDSRRLVRAAPDSAVIDFATSLDKLIGRLQEINPEACWAFAFDGPDDPRDVFPRALIDGLKLAHQRLSEAAGPTQAVALAPAQIKQVREALLADLRAKGQIAALEQLRSGANHAAFCPALRDLLRAALELPEHRRVTALRVILSGG
jgi:hypothetical protein